MSVINWGFGTLWFANVRSVYLRLTAAVNRLPKKKEVMSTEDKLGAETREKEMRNGPDEKKNKEK